MRCDFRAPGAQLQLTDDLDSRHRHCAVDAAAAAAAVSGASAPCCRCAQVHQIVQLEIAALISIDINVILMLGCMVRATFFFFILQLRAHDADAAVC